MGQHDGRRRNLRAATAAGLVTNMCGIAGICSPSPQARDQLARRLEEMTSLLAHRGPDEQGHFMTDHMGLGSQRLKIIDLTTGRMPVSNETGSVQVVYNGEIYNHRVLRENLRRHGHVFRTKTDTEVLVHLYEDRGAELVHDLQGMFAFALWDEEAATLLLARDRLGIKPLYYRVVGGTLFFASELKSLVTVAPDPPEIDLRALAEYLALGYIGAPRTIYRQYRKLSPGSVLQWRSGLVETDRYWRFPVATDGRARHVDEAVDLLDAQLQEAVADRLVADVPVGAFLSGGVDSSVVVAMAARCASGPLKTFSVGFAGDNELPYARKVAEEYATEHYELILDAERCGIADMLLEYFDEPFGDSSAVPTYYVSKLAREQVTVALSGDGGDELFAGYDQYAHDARWAWVDRIPRVVRRLLFETPTYFLPYGMYGWNMLRAIAADREVRYTLYRTTELNPRRGGLLSAALLDRVPRREDLFQEHLRDAATLPVAARFPYVDAVTYLPDDILTKVDRMSMAHSLEARVPILDHRVVELAAGLPMEWKLRNGERKWIFKRLAERYVPPEVLYRAKRGFSLPIARWLRAELSSRLHVLEDEESLAGAYLHRPTVCRLLAEHQRGRRDHSDVLWRLMMLEAWLRHAANVDAGSLAEASTAETSGYGSR